LRCEKKSGAKESPASTLHFHRNIRKGERWGPALLSLLGLSAMEIAITKKASLQN
jgi:hypothetical protein